MNTSPKGTIRAAGVQDIVALVPTLLGFNPRESLVAMILTGNHLEVTVRLDLDEAPFLDEVFSQVEERFPGFTTVLLAYSEKDPKKAWDMLTMAQMNKRVVGVVLVGENGKWFSGSESGFVDAGTPAGLKASLLIGAPKASREEVEEMVAHTGEVEELDVDFYQELRTITAEDLGRWAEAARRTGSPDALGLAGVAAYMSGNGGLANICRDKLPALHPASGLLDFIISKVTRPEEVRGLIDSVFGRA